jgi:hypothetical protein
MGVGADFISQFWSGINEAFVAQVAAVTLLLVVTFFLGEYFGGRVRSNADLLADPDFRHGLICATCDRPLREASGILLGPPRTDGFARREHICVQCYPLFVAAVVSISESSKRMQGRMILKKGEKP